MKIRLLSKISLLLILLAGSLALSSCSKDETCSVVITVENELGIAQPGYMVVFDNHRGAVGANTQSYNTQLVTDAKGRVEATFKLPAIIEARAYAPGESVFDQINEDGWVSVKLKPGQTVAYTIVVPN
ncbi:MAG: hypothetical protein M0D57_03240 [Sphingobacteriales bacterium JAD_PAG50586_3]|nr:MAG: hypothetical protein M0D57_03240 [Sphingobacteriales bacterium JAD_PAG50586_3]